jgi:hypothetical protein
VPERPGLVPDWRDRFAAMVAGREPAPLDWFGASSTMSPALQASIYVEQYRLRLHDGMRAELPGLVRWVPEPGEGGWDTVFAAWLLEHPATSWTLNRVADGFPDWWAGRGAPTPQVELARLDAAVSRAFEAAEPPPLPIPVPDRVVLAPSVALLWLTHTVHEVRHALLTDTEPPLLRAEAAGVVVYRGAREVRHWVPPAPVWWILDAVLRGEPLAQAIGAPLAHGTTPAALQASLSGWMAEVATRRLLSPA